MSLRSLPNNYAWAVNLQRGKAFGFLNSTLTRPAWKSAQTRTMGVKPLRQNSGIWWRSSTVTWWIMD